MKKLISTLIFLCLTIQLNSYTFKRKEVISINHKNNLLIEVTEHIKKYECYRSKPYVLNKKWYIGYGHLILHNENFTSIDENEATKLLIKDLQSNININNLNFEGVIDLKYNQLLAISLLTYNIGVTKFKTYDLYDSIMNKKDCSIWLKYCHFRSKKHKKLLERRIFEYKLFNN